MVLARLVELTRPHLVETAHALLVPLTAPTVLLVSMELKSVLLAHPVMVFLLDHVWPARKGSTLPEVQLYVKTVVLDALHARSMELTRPTPLAILVWLITV